MANGKRSVLILGGCGYVGGHLAEIFLKQGYKVVLYDLVIPSSKLNDSRVDVLYVKGNLLHKERLLEVTREHQPFMVIHLASYGMSGAAMLSPLCDEINIRGVENTIDACVSGGVECLIYTSTYNTCFAGQEIVGKDETLPTAPLDAHTDRYGPSKTVAEARVERAHLAPHSAPTSTRKPMGAAAAGGPRCLHTYILRPAAIYGEDEERHFPRILQHMDSGVFSLFRIARAVRVDWVHVDNLAAAYSGMLRRHLELYPRSSGGSSGAAGGAFPNTYFISDGTPIDSWDFLLPLAEARECPFPSLCVPLSLMLCIAFMAEAVYHATGLAPFLTRAEVYKVGVTHFFSIDKARRELGYSPTLTTQEGARRMAHRHRLVECAAGPGVPRTTNCAVNSLFFRVAPWYWWMACVGGMALVLYLAYYDAGLEVPLTSAAEVGVAMRGAMRGASVVEVCEQVVLLLQLVGDFCLGQLRLLAYTLFGSRVGIQWVWTLAFGTHLLEAAFCVAVADGIGVCPLMLVPWFIQTTLLGGPSLSIVLDRMHRGYHHRKE